MAAQFNIEKESEEVFEFICGPCHVDGEVIQARGYCSECQDYLCDICIKHHLRSKPSRHHTLLDENYMPIDKKTTYGKASDICSERCQKHLGNIIEYYCQSHDFLGCSKCFILDNHRMCKGFVYIDDATADLYESLEYKTYTGKIERIVTYLSKSSSMQQDSDENIKLYSIQAKREIKSFRKSINKFLDRLENKIDKKVSQMKESQTSKWMSISKQLERLDNDIKIIKRAYEQTRTSGQTCNSYINMKRNVYELKQLEDQMVTVEKEIRVSEYIFKPDVNLQNIIKDTKTFGMLVTSKEGDTLPATTTLTQRSAENATTTLTQRSAENSTTTPTQSCAENATTTQTQSCAENATTTPTQSCAENATTTQTQRCTENATNTPLQWNNSVLIHALTQRQHFYEKMGSKFYAERQHYVLAIESVKAGRLVDFGRLATQLGLSPLPKAECEAYNRLHKK